MSALVVFACSLPAFLLPTTLRSPVAVVPATFRHYTRCSVSALVTEEEVELAVQKAEDSWAAALAAREKAEKLSIDAEEAAEDAGTSSEAVSDELNASTKFSLAMLSGASSSMDKSLEATRLLGEAVQV